MMSPQCRRAVELGAVSGFFTPEDMGTSLGLDGASPSHRAALWRELSAYVTEVLMPAYGWQIKPDARLAILPQLVSRAQVRRLIEDAPPAWRDDSFAGFLRDLLGGNPVVVETSSYGRNHEDSVLTEMRRAGLLLDAVQFAQQSPAVDVDALGAIGSEVKRHIAELRQRRDLLIVLPRRHFGYETERRNLSRFLRSMDDTHDDRPVFLSGIGGVGKSALHARLFRYWQLRSDGPLTVTLDFDRRQLNAGSPVELLMEILRQCAVGVYEKGFPPRIAKEVGDGLRDMRYGLTEIPLDASFDRQMSGIAAAHITALQENWAAPLRHQPIAIAFDSFEALDRRGGSAVEIVLRLEEVLRRSLPLVRSLFAGREEPLDEEQMAARFGGPERRMRLSGITPAAGQQLLSEEDARLAGPDGTPLIDPDQHLRIAQILKGHPLAMLMLVQFAHARPEEIDRLLGELGQQNGQFEAEFAQVFLYERILERISNPEVRALAHPGLVLRQLNTDLIREVLAVMAVDHDPDTPISQAEAERLKQALEREYWLVEADDQGFDLRHRPDLRRLMLPGLFAKPRSNDSAPERDKKEKLTARALDVCARAARYFREGPAQDDTAARVRWQALPERLRRAHGFYYASFVAPYGTVELSVDDAREIELELGEDIETMPLEWRGLIKALLDIEVSVEEQGTLGGDLFEQVESRMYRTESKVGRGAKDKFRPSTPPVESASSEPETTASAARMEREIADAFARIEFDRVAALASLYMRALDEDDGTAARRFDELAQKDVTLTPLWKVLLVGATQDFGLSEFDPNFLANKDAPFHELRQAVAMVGKSGVDQRDIVTKFVRYIGDVNNAFAYRQLAFKVFDWAEGNKWKFLGSFEALALAAEPFHDRLQPDTDHLESSEFLALAQKILAKPELRLRDIQEVYSAIKFSRFQLSTDLFEDMKESTARLLRGLSPELYEPLTACLRAADAETLDTLEILIHQDVPNWPVDLNLDPSTVIETAPIVIETADRYGLLRRLAQVLTVRQPEVQRLVDMHDVLTDWFFPPLRGKDRGDLPEWAIKALGAAPPLH